MALVYGLTSASLTGHSCLRFLYYNAMANFYGHVTINNYKNTVHNQTINNAPETTKPTIEAEEAQTVPERPDFFSTKFTMEDIDERLQAELNQSTNKRDFCRRLYMLQHIDYINLSQFSSDEQRAVALNHYQTKYQLCAEDFRKARV